MANSEAGKTGSRKYRWLLCLLLFLISVNNYMDRQLFSIVAPVVTTEFRLSASEIALIINSFLLAYAIGQVFSGRFMDWAGARLGFTLCVMVWSLAGIFTSCARGVLSFSLFRFLLGAAESGNFPGGVKVLAEWFPQEERTTAVGVFTSGVSIGALLTPPVAAFLIVHFGWQVAFVAVGVPGLLWILAWRHVYRPAPLSAGAEDGSQPLALDDGPADGPWGNMRRWSFLLRQRQAWGVILGRLLEEPVAWLFYSWLPLYLTKFMGVSLMKTGFLLTVPFMAQDIGFILGGFAASRLMKKGWTVDQARKCVIFVSATCMMSSLFAVAAPTPLAFVLLIGLATFGHGSWSSNIMSMPSDIVPASSVGTLYGMTGCGGALGSMLFTQMIGMLVDKEGSFNTVFTIGGLLPLFAAIVMFIVGGKIQPLASLRLAPAQMGTKR